MNREELDKLRNIALRESVAAGEHYTRYRFAELVAAAEREKCAKKCESYIAAGIGKEMADAIRAMGNE
jgi:hypothetical protein